jgi:hypothetical protein
MSLCKYKNIFGEPNKGVHSIRIFGFAFVDVILTIIIAMITGYLFNVSLIESLVFWFLLGIFAHWLFCVNTTLNTFLGLN